MVATFKQKTHRDSSPEIPQAFFYLDPPYYNSDMGHYDGYTIEDFEMLLNQLSKLEGRFLLSSYPSIILSKFVEENGWHQMYVNQTVSVSRNKSNLKKKQEVLTSNYPLIS
jgi:DNA adenine methylase